MDRIAYEFLVVFHCNYGRICYRFRNKARYWPKKRQFFILRLFNYTIHWNLLDFFPQMLTQTVQIPKLLDGAKILPKISTLCVERKNVAYHIIIS